MRAALLALAVSTLSVGCTDNSATRVATAAPAGESHRVELPNGGAVELGRISSGTFAMGASPGDPDAASNEEPRHDVTISKDLWVATTETQVGWFRAFVEDTGYVTEAETDASGGWIVEPMTESPRQRPGVSWKNPGFVQTDAHPVVQVSWNDAAAFCAWLSKRSDLEFRLPTEAEWEYFARAGGSERYGHHSDGAQLKGTANLADQSLVEVHRRRESAENWTDGHVYTAPVAQYPPNPWGLHDIIGNAWEWCADAHDDEFYSRSPSVDPFNEPTEDSKMRAIRGGGWFDDHTRARVSMRAWFFPVFRTCQLSGFRIVADASR